MNMHVHCVHDAKDDPTGTMPLQRRWSRDMEQRWAHVKRMMPAMLAEHTNPLNLVSHSVLTGKGDPVHHFNIWLDEALRQLVMGTNGNWMMTYVRSAADAGLKFAGDPTGAADRTHILQSLVVTELQGIMDAVSQQATRIFATGVMERRPLARMRLDINAIVDAVGVRRSRLLVSFYTVKSFNAAALDGYRARGFTKVGIRPEKRKLINKLAKDAHPYEGMVAVQTAEDDDVCPECEEIAADGPYYIDEAESLIPAHPNCRCALIPADEDENADFAEDAGPEDEPRDDHGRWTAESGDTRSNVEKYNVKVEGKGGQKKQVLAAINAIPPEHAHLLKTAVFEHNEYLYSRRDGRTVIGGNSSYGKISIGEKNSAGKTMDVSGITMHELGHAVDKASGQIGALSNKASSELTADIKADAEKLTPAELKNAGYFFNNKVEGASNSKEQFAELYRLAYSPSRKGAFGLSQKRAETVFAKSIAKLKQVKIPVF